MTEVESNALVSRELLDYTNESQTKVGKGAFCYSENLAEVDLPNVTEVEDFAFQNCPNLLSINLESVEKIGSYAFWNCNKLTSIDISSIREIPTGTFSSCTALESIAAENVEKLGVNALHSTKLSSLELPKCTTVGKYALKNCKELSEVSLPEARHIKEGAFEGCESLENITLAEARDIAAGAFNTGSEIDVTLFNATSISTRAFGDSTSTTTGTLRTNIPGLELANENVTVISLPNTVNGRIYFIGDTEGYTFKDINGNEVDVTVKANWNKVYSIERENGAQGQVKVFYEKLFGDADSNRDRNYYWAISEEDSEHNPLPLLNITNEADLYDWKHPSEVYDNVEEMWTPVRAYYEEEGDDQPISIFNDDGSSKEDVIASIKEKYLNDEIWIRAPKNEAIAYYKAVVNNNLYVGNNSIFTAAAEINTIIPHDSIEWSIGTVDDLTQLKEYIDEVNDLDLQDWFKKYNIWTSTERDANYAYKWKFEDPRKDYGTFKALAELYLRNLYLTGEDVGVAPQMYPFPVQCSDPEHLFTENNESSYDFSNEKVKLEDFSELLENVAEEGEEPEYILKEGARITPQMCLRMAYEDCISGYQRFSAKPYVITYKRDYYGDCEYDEENKPIIDVYSVANIKRFSPTERVMKTITYTDPMRVDTESVVLPPSLLNKMYKDEGDEIITFEEEKFEAHQIPDCLKEGTTNWTLEDIYADAYNLENIAARYQDEEYSEAREEFIEYVKLITSDFEEELTEEFIEADIARFATSYDVDDQGDYTTCNSVASPSILRDWFDRIKAMKSYSDKIGDFDFCSKKSSGKMILVRVI